jgi:hypothetical protein
MKYGIFASIGPGLPVMISWRETEALAQLVAKRYRRIHKLVQVFKVGIIRNAE